MDHRTSTYLKRKHRWTVGLMAGMAIIGILVSYSLGKTHGTEEVHRDLRGVTSGNAQRVGPLIIAPFRTWSPKNPLFIIEEVK